MARPVALVTGASAGIGAELARRYAEAGFDLVLVARRRERLEALSEQLSAECFVVAQDLAAADGPQRVHDAVSQEGLHIEELVCSAGLGSFGSFVELPLERELQQIRVNVEALVALCRLFLPAMIERGHGRVLNLASLASFQAGPGMATYCATKAFVLSFSEALSEELRGTGVTVTAHCPGPVASEFGAAAGNDASRIFSLGVASSSSVAAHAFRTSRKGQVVAVHGLQNRMTVFLGRFTPRPVLRRLAAWMNEPVQATRATLPSEGKVGGSALSSRDPE